MRKYRILLVDDDPIILKMIGPSLESQDYEVFTAEGGDEAFDLLMEKDFDLVLTDLVMDPVDGISVLKKAKNINPQLMVIILTGYGDLNSAINALRLNADDFLLKPCEPEEIFFRVSRSLEKLELKKRIETYEDILPICCRCKKIRDDAGREPGTGEWMQVEKYMWKKAGLSPSSTYCPDCMKKVHKEIDAME